MRSKLAAAFVLAAMAVQAQAQSGCGEEGREQFRQYKAVLHPVITARIRSLRHGSPGERTSVVSLSITRAGVLASSKIVRSSGSPQLDARMIDILPAGLQLPPLPSCYGGSSLTVMFPVRFHPDPRL